MLRAALAHSHARWIALALLLALTVRLAALAVRPMISRDGVYNVNHTKTYDRGDGYRGHTVPGVLWAMSTLRHATGLEWQRAGHVLAIGFGIFTVIPLFLLALKAAGPAVARWAAVMYAAHPMAVYYDCDIMGVSMSAFWMTWSVLATWEALERGKITMSLAASVCFTFAALSRREAIMLVPAAGLLAAALFVSSVSERHRDRFEPSFKFLLCAPIFVAGTSLIISLSSPLLTYGFEQLLEGASGQTSAILEAVEDIDQGTGTAAVGQWLGGAARAVGWVYVPFFIWGLVAARRLPMFWFLAGISAIAILLPELRTIGAGANSMSPRYFMTSVPVFMVFAAIGLEQCSQRLLQKRHQLVMTAAAAVIVIAVATAIYPRDRKQWSWRQAAAFVLERYGEHRGIASSRSQVAYYAGGYHVPISARPEDLDVDRIHFIAVKPTAFDETPGYLEKLPKRARAVEVWRLEEAGREPVVIYELRKP